MGSPGEDEESSTRYLETSRGVLSYFAVADLVAGHLADLLDQIAEGVFSSRAITAELIQEFHGAILALTVPKMAGKWRLVDVAVGKHLPPPFYEVPMLMRDYAEDLSAQIIGRTGGLDRQIETLAFAEGQMLHIHPFEDFNGRAVRAFLAEVLNRLDMPPIETSVIRNTPEFERYKLALRAFDMKNPSLLRQCWVDRLDTQLSSYS